jgi:hypothetical protein
VEEAYEDAEFERPRNWLGMLKDQPLEEMERMLREHVQVTDQDLRDLAQQRVRAAQNYLLEQNATADRLFRKEADPATPPEDEAMPRARVELGLH